MQTRTMKRGANPRFNERMAALFAVPRELMVERREAHKRAAAQNPKRRGPRPKNARVPRVPGTPGQEDVR